MKAKPKNESDLQPKATKKRNLVLREIKLNYVLALPDTWEKVELACSELGWSKAGILKQMIHGFMAAHGTFYAQAGIVDAHARGMSEEDYFRALRDKGIQDVHRYTDGRPAFGKAPIDDIDPIPNVAANKRRYNVINLSAYNFVLLQVAQIVDTGDLIQVVSRMVVKHLDDRWERSYLTQIERDKRCKFL